MNELTTLIINNLTEILIAVVGTVLSVYVVPWIANTAIPWLKEKRLYSLVEQFVKAAEKKAEAGSLAKALKKDYVIERLTAMGITVTPEIDAFIEAAVKELDIAANAFVGELVEAIEVTTGDAAEDDAAAE